MKKRKYIITKEFKNAGLVLRPQSRLKKVYKQLKDILSIYEINLHVEKNSAKLLDVEGLEFNQMCKVSDFIISLGGDGTILYTCRSSYPQQTPILGINAGNLGFLTLIKQDEMKWFFKEFADGKCHVENRMMLEVKFIKANKCIKKDIAFNDIVFARSASASMIKVDAFIGDKLFNSYYGDGVIAATPTGSTAYNLSAGGAIIYPLSKTFILTSICPHSLTQRPLVLPMDFDVKFKSNDCAIVVDGQNYYKINEFDSVEISMAKKCAKLIGHERRDYFDILRDKLSWGNVC